MSAASAAADDNAMGSGGFRRVGVMGGMFDPVHRGHLQAAAGVRRQLGLESVLMIPCGNPVHRGKSFASADDRCAMLSLAIADEPWLELDRRECMSEAPSYTVDTLGALHAERLDVSWHLLMGIDAFLALETWRRWRDLFELAHIIVVTRPGYTLAPDSLTAALRTEWERRVVTDAATLRQSRHGAVICVDVQSADLSSTQVRRLLQTAADPTPILHPAVAAYVRSHGLYQSGEPA